jgi:hypothetical protein
MSIARYWVVAVLLFAVLLVGGLYAIRPLLQDDCPRGQPGDAGAACDDTHYATPALIATVSLYAGMDGEDILRRGYVRVETGGEGRSVGDPSYLIGRPEYAYLWDGETIEEIRPGTTLGPEHFRPLPSQP